MSLAVKPIFSKRQMYTAAYMLIGGELRPEKPTQCIFRANFRGFCHITSKGKRRRKIGLEYPLFIYDCSDHCVCFTVYPLGWSQYGRRPLIEIAPDGSDFDTDADVGIEEIVDVSISVAVDIWQGTAFGAAIDADCGQKWPLAAPGILVAGEPKPFGVFVTQRRHIAGVLRLFRIDIGSDDKARELVAARLPISFSALNSSAAKIRDGPAEASWQRSGSECWLTTKRLTPPRCFLKQLLELGAALNFWGSPMYG